MAIANLKELYIDGLQDLYSACKQSLAVTKELAKAAKNDDLAKALTKGADGIKEGMDQLTEMLQAHGESASGTHCKGMEGLVAEARKHALEEDFGDEDARDAAIIAQYQRLCHYAITGYGTCRTWAKRLDLKEDAAHLQEMLDSTYDGDDHMTELAENGVNKAAKDGK